MDKEEITESLLKVPIFSGLDSQTLQQIVDLGRIKHYEKGSIILHEEDTDSAFFVIKKGKVKVSRCSEDSKEVIFALLNDSGFFGEMAILDGLSRSATVTAIEDSDLFIIQHNDFIGLLKIHPEVAIALLQELTSRLRTADMKIKALSLKDAEGKVATVLLQIADEIGVIKKGIIEIERMPIQQELANMAGTSRETVSRALHSFAKKGFIEIEGINLRIINYEKLKENYG